MRTEAVSGLLAVSEPNKVDAAEAERVDLEKLFSRAFHHRVEHRNAQESEVFLSASRVRDTIKISHDNMPAWRVIKK
jgi:hypothetical protein